MLRTTMIWRSDAQWWNPLTWFDGHYETTRELMRKTTKTDCTKPIGGR